MGRGICLPLPTAQSGSPSGETWGSCAAWKWLHPVLPNRRSVPARSSSLGWKCTYFYGASWDKHLNDSNLQSTLMWCRIPDALEQPKGLLCSISLWGVLCYLLEDLLVSPGTSALLLLDKVSPFMPCHARVADCHNLLPYCPSCRMNGLVPDYLTPFLEQEKNLLIFPHTKFTCRGNFCMATVLYLAGKKKKVFGSYHGWRVQNYSQDTWEFLGLLIRYRASFCLFISL